MMPENRNKSATVVKIHGLYRSGTNYIQWLIDHNFQDVIVLVNELGFKHGPVPDTVDWDKPIHSDPKKRTIQQKWPNHFEAIRLAWDQETIRYVFVIKNPYSWVISYKRYRGGFNVPAYMETWNSINSRWKTFHDLHPDRCVFIRYEDLICDLGHALDRIRDRFQLVPNGPYQNADKKLDTGGNITSKDFDTSYYSECKYLSALTSDQLKQIGQLANGDLMQAFSYPVIDS